MKMYEMLIEGMATSEYIRGRISGIIYALSGMPKKGYGWRVEADGRDWFLCFNATEDQKRSIVECIETLYPKAFMGVREVG